MTLSRDIYRELEDILGLKNISEDPAVIDTYTFQGVMVAAGTAGLTAAVAAAENGASVIALAKAIEQGEIPVYMADSIEELA